MIYVCQICEQVCELKNVKTGRFLDVAYGNPKWFNEYIQKTHCCNSEDFDSYTNDEGDELNHPKFDGGSK